jgi:hypothetical protein
MNRRAFLTSSLAAACCGPLAAKTFAGRDEKLILSAPLTHSDWILKAGMIWGEDGVRHMLDACKACGWSRIYWRALDGGRTLYKSSLALPEGKWDDDNFWSPKSAADQRILELSTPSLTPSARTAIGDKMGRIYDYAHFDSLAAAVRYGHQIGLQIHAWVSINEDDHGWGLRSQFSKQHPQFRWQHRDGRVYRSQLSFAYPEVRQYKAAILDELLRNYAIDGLLLDWIRTGDVRDNPQTDADGVAESGYEAPLIASFKKQYGVDPRDLPNGDERWVRCRAQPQTEFMRMARHVARSQNRAVPVAVLVGHPWHYRGSLDPISGNLRGLLLDTTTWAREGLMDAAVAAGYYRSGGNAELAYQALKTETEGKVDIWSYAWVPQNVAEFEQDFSLAQRLGAKQILFWEADYIDDRAQKAELERAMSSRAKW